ncbi:MAG: carboxypeptidase [Opitutales bacterium]|nr:carboxypeptidase [Opitutales bacterium]
MEIFLTELRRIDVLSQISSLLGWDEQVNLPSGQVCLEQRARQCSEIAEFHHREFTRPAFAEQLQQLEEQMSGESDELGIILREVRRDLDRATKLPAEFVSQKAAHESTAYHAWKDARARNDFAAYAPILEQTMQFARKEAAYVGFEDNPYDYHIDKHDPGMDAISIGKLFDDLQVRLIPLAERILALAEKANIPELRGFPKAKQEIFLREVVHSLGFDFSRGRIDIAVHPFCSGNGSDTRLTTRYDEDNPLDSLFSAIHETGHGLYEQGLPNKWWGTPLGKAAGMAVHESQSRVWENQIGRSRAFWNHWEPRFRELFTEALAGISSEQLHLVVNKVTRNPIRVDADEVTYNLHVILRFELERALFRNELKVIDLPHAWSEKAEHLLGLRPANDTEGVLQDVHWSGGAFGYFPSYCLGNLLAAQLWDTAKIDLPNLDSATESGDTGPFLTWLGEKIHRHGRRMNLFALTENSTSRSLSPDSLIRYLENRYLALYEEV